MHDDDKRGVRCQWPGCWSQAATRMAIGARVICVCERHFAALNDSLLVKWPKIKEDADVQDEVKTTIPVRRT